MQRVAYSWVFLSNVTCENENFCQSGSHLVACIFLLLVMYFILPRRTDCIDVLSMEEAGPSRGCKRVSIILCTLIVFSVTVPGSWHPLGRTRVPPNATWITRTRVWHTPPSDHGCPRPWVCWIVLLYARAPNLTERRRSAPRYIGSL